MKKILLAAAIFGFLFSNAQKIYLYPQKPIEKLYPWNNNFQKKLSPDFKNLLTATPLSQAKLLYTLKDNNRIFSLPQDNMICLVPDMKQFNVPNAAISKLPFKIPPELKNQLQHQPGKIPNPAIPLILPKEKITENN